MFLEASNLSYFKNRMEKETLISNLFFSNYRQFCYNMNKPSPTIILQKIKHFRENKGNFNSTYFDNMPDYFFSPRNDKDT
jgi:hypothetical protein